MRKTFLFVDDEPNILAGLRRNLRHLRKSMDFHFVESGEEALSCLAVHSVDVIITDMRMPGMDGATLLSIVQERYPAVVRIMLSGQSDRGSVLQTVASVHQFLTKPISATVLQKKLHQACSYLDLLPETSLKSLICRTGNLPSQPAAFAELMQIIQEPDCSASDLARIIEQDLGMCAKILQLVNSSFFGTHREIFNPTDAVTLLGVNLIRELVCSAGIFKEMPPTCQPGHFLDSFHNHNLKVAGLARLIIRDEQLGKEAEDNAFLAGLLHDVGKLLFTSILEEQYCQVLRLAENESLLSFEAEQRVLQTDHAVAGGYLLGLWGLPAAVVEAVSFHHQPEQHPKLSFSPTLAVHIADALFHQHPAHTDGRSPGLNTSVLEQVGLVDCTDHWLTLYEQVDT